MTYKDERGGEAVITIHKVAPVVAANPTPSPQITTPPPAPPPATAVVSPAVPAQTGKAASIAQGTGGGPSIAATAAPPKPTTRELIATSTETNKFLLEGNPADVVLVISEHPDAPHVSINLRGDPTFKDNKADLCFVGSDPLSVDSEIEVFEALSKKGASSTKRLAASCDVSRPDLWDVAVGRRSDFLALPRAAWDRLDKALQDAKEKELLTVLDAEVKGDREARNIAALSNESRVSNDGINGWGFVFPESETSVVCTIAAKGDATFQELVNANTKRLQKDLGRRASLKVVTLDAETAFRESKKKQCGVVFGMQPDLKAIILGFRRDKVSYKTASVWLSSDSVDSALAAADGQKAAETQAQADDRRKAEAERELRRQREEADGTRIREATEALRRQHGAKVAALAAELKTGAGEALQFTPQQLAQSQSSWFGDLFPQFVSWMQERRNEGWEPVSHDVDVLDFGEAAWNQRTLKLILVRTHGTLKNRSVGKYLEFCFDNAYVADPEFQMRRESFITPCDQSATMVPNYLKGLAFRSEWNAK